MLNRTDLLQLVGFPDDVEKMVDKVVSDNWKKGIQRHNHEEGSWTWKLSGRPCTSFFVVERILMSRAGPT
jgi:hypothetical protein